MRGACFLYTALWKLDEYKKQRCSKRRRKNELEASRELSLNAQGTGGAFKFVLN